MTLPKPSRESALMAAFIDVADTMIDDYDVVELLDRVATHCVHLLDVSAAGLLLTDGQGNLRLLASSNEQARLMELFQLQTEQYGGPCVDCYRTGEPVTAVNLSDWHYRWPGFVVEAARQGFHTVHALPMRLRNQAIGGLNLFREATSPLNEQDLRLGQALADIATIAVLQRRALQRSETITEQLQGAFNSRVVIEQAKGALSSSGNIDVAAAFEALRGYARAHRRLLGEVCRQVVEDKHHAARVLDYAKVTGAER
jgi:transcriptional regulator with GAF, ATPase, and Fis domain